MADRKQLLIIDTDAGLDDAQAILMAMSSSHVEIIALTTVTGNTRSKQVGRNLLRLLREAGHLDIPVYVGCDEMLMGWKKPPDINYHGTDGFGDVFDSNPSDDVLIKKEHGVQALLNLSKKYPGDVTLVALGPLTNVAIAIRLDPGFGKRLRSCYIMGGNYHVAGNVTSYAEFNFYSDPEAAQIVLSDLGCPITIACWDLCVSNSFPWSWYEELVSKPTKIAQFMKTVERKTIETFYEGDGHLIKNDKNDDEHDLDCSQLKKGYLLADQYAMAAALNDDVITARKSASVKVDTGNSDTRGRMEVDWNEHQNEAGSISIILSVDMSEIKHMLEEAFAIK